MSPPLHTLALMAVPGLPLLLAILLPAARSRRLGLTLAPWAALPGLLIALAGWPATAVTLPWLLLGTSLQVGELQRLFLFFTSALWLATSVYARAYFRDDPRRAQVWAFFLLCLAGNLTLILAADIVTFYLGYLTMSLAAYGLIVHANDSEARRAGRIYIVLVILGEACLLPGIWLAANLSSTLALADIAAAVGGSGDLSFWLLAGALGIKAALVPLHIWLPLAHSAAPTPASAVLSGALVKAGVLGWISILPVGLWSRPDLAAVFIVLGLLGAFGGALAGIVQSRPKAVLAYSSVSQMGLLIVLWGIALSAPAASVAAITAIGIYALHHALAKGALFLGVGCVQSTANARRRRITLLLLLLPALSLSGLPLTSGIVAKEGLKQAVYTASANWQVILGVALPLAAVGTTLLMARFLWLTTRLPTGPIKPGLFTPWCLLLAAVAGAYLLPFATQEEMIADSAAASGIWSALWPILLGLTLALTAMRRALPAPRIPEGDILWPMLAWGRALWAWYPSWLPPALARLAVRGQRRARVLLEYSMRWLVKAE